MNVLVGFESSGVVREAFKAKGHNAWSCDLLSSEIPGNHYTMDIFQLLDTTAAYWDLAIFHPTCTYLCSSGLHWNKRTPGRQEKTDKAIEDVKRLMGYDIERVAIENPIGCISSIIKKPDQIIQPYWFKEDASKATCLWLKNLPLLQHTGYFPARIVNGKKRWGNQTDSGQNRLAPSVDRWKERSKTYSGIAAAMAEQWGSGKINEQFKIINL